NPTSSFAVSADPVDPFLISYFNPCIILVILITFRFLIRSHTEVAHGMPRGTPVENEHPEIYETFHTERFI
ncbi:hypothetical protein SK128_015217, partial [Halocaridina rubra]